MTDQLNRDLFAEVADAIETHPEHFDMSTFWGGGPRALTGTPAECGTTGCVAGWAATLAGYRRTSGHFLEDIDDVAASALGLTVSQANEIFYGWVDHSPDRIISDLRGIAKGDVVWHADSLHGAWVPA